MHFPTVLQSQYHAALEALRQAIEQCPESLWLSGTPPAWRVAYHTLFYAHFYLHQQEKDFTPWAKHQPEANFIAFIKHENNRPPKACEPFTQGQVLEYWTLVNGEVDRLVDALDLSASQCGFPWYVMSTMEHQLVNLRHIQHHAAILSSRIRHASGTAIPWVGKPG
jgi:hypothetical protein